MNNNKFFTFLFSLIPGAGHMYYGLYKQGASLMLSFCLIIFLSVELYMDMLLFFLPVIWFFSFFQTHNISKLSPEEFHQIKDRWLIPESVDTKLLYRENIKYQVPIAVTLICIGIFLLGRNMTEMFFYVLPERLRNIMNYITWRIPQIIVSVVIIYVGIRLISGKKKELNQEASDKPEENPAQTGKDGMI